MSINRGITKGASYPIWELDILPKATSADIHPHSSYTDSKQSLVEVFDEARRNSIYEKGAIDHGNPADEDINHPATFLESYEDNLDKNYTSTEIYPIKFENIQDILGDNPGETTLTDADPEKLREDLDTIDDLTQLKRRNGTISDLPVEEMLDYSLNYSMVVPHGIELDYNPAIEASKEGEKQESVDSYEEAIIDFLKEAESRNSGYNYILGSSHYVNTPFKPRYVKKDSLFEQMSYEEKLDGLERYREKEIAKIESLSDKLGDMAVPRISGELMTEDELDDLNNFVYGQKAAINDEINEEFTDRDMMETTEDSVDIQRPGVFVVGAHPTLIERNEELLDAFREKQGLNTKENITEDLNQFMYDITNTVDELPEEAETVSLHDAMEKQGLAQFLNYSEEERFYPSKALEKYYDPMIEASKEEDNFIFEVNGKGVSRQHPSIFWDMLDENVFGSDSHRPGEQPDRTQKYYENRLGGETVFLSEKWLSQLEQKNNR